MYLITKSGVNIENIRPEMAIALLIVMQVFEKYDQIATITSTTEGIHKEDSLHYKGLAFDIRISHLKPQELSMISSELILKLAQADRHYQLVSEKTHIHIEYDTKKSTYYSYQKNTYHIAQDITVPGDKNETL